jgi:hypothetical protein
LVFPFLLHIHFVDTKLELHVPFDSKFLSGMMQVIHLHNNQHFEEELVLGLQRREALVALAVGVVAVRVVAVVVVVVAHL